MRTDGSLNVSIAAEYIGPKTDTRSWYEGPKATYRYFSDMSDEELRGVARLMCGPGQYQKYTRAMLNALFKNRPGLADYVVEIESPEAA